MPVDQVLISYIRSCNWINVLLLRSMNLFKPVLLESPREMLEVSPNGIAWSEQNLEYRIMVDKFFEIAVKTNDGNTPYTLVEMLSNNHLVFGLSLRRITYRALEEHTIEVDQKDLPLHVNALTPCSFHCSNCANEIISRWQYLHIRQVPLTTMRPQNYFSARYRLPVYPGAHDLFYGLNYLVICTALLGDGVTSFRNRRRIECSRCKQYVGEFLGRAVAVELYADALRMLTEESPLELKEIFGHVTPTQIMLRLLHDAEPTHNEKTRLFLKATRPDGQLHYLQLQVNIRQLHILRSEVETSEVLDPAQPLPIEVDTSSESDFEMNSIDLSSSSTTNSESTDEGMDRSVARPKTPEEIPPKSVQYVKLRGFRGCRVKYLFSGNDEDLNRNHNIIEAWRDSGTHLLRISYEIMAELMGELNANEQMVAALEKQPPPSQSDQPRLSYIIYENDEEFYAGQEQYAKRSK
ncbi:uncharacterized protein LOC108087915 [Drosophila ficusphila]|uniref:uncharacterized protein LOC108087915 n=1 Tax=Drosophila ficusphila TaxID=30025 RepID=UPI0007E62689|nr:uncharacterized protein LOC108087915 [Drosophila ficusphila]